jgi:hypothetical protein
MDNGNGTSRRECFTCVPAPSTINYVLLLINGKWKWKWGEQVAPQTT